MKKVVFCLLALCTSLEVLSATYNMTTTRPPCSSSWSVTGNTYTCNSGTITLSSGDNIVSGGGGAITVIGQGGVTLAGSNTIGASTATVNLQTTYGSLVTSGSGNVIHGNVAATSGAIDLTNTTVNGNVSTNGTVTLSGGSVTGNVTGRNGVTTSNNAAIGGNVLATTGTVSLSGGSVTGSVRSNCCTVSTTNTNIGNGVSSNNSTVTINGGTIAGTISSSGGSGVSISNATITSGSISSTQNISVSNSTVGSPNSIVNISSDNSVTLSSNTSVYGNVTSDTNANALNIDGTSIVYGVCSSNSNSTANPAQYPRCVGSAPLAEWRMDEASWTGASGEVLDSSGNGHHGRAAYANGSGPFPTTASASKAYISGAQSTCNYGQFDTTTAPIINYTQVSLPSTPVLPAAFTFTAWIRSTSVGTSGQRILVNDDAQNGWGLSLGDGASGSLRLFNRNITNSGSVSGSGSNPSCGVFCLDTNSVISNNTWYFVAVAVNTTSRTVTLYVINTAGTILAQTSSAFSGNWSNGSGIWSIGGETAASSEGTQASFHFKGNIDEVGVYSTALSSTALQAVRTRVRSCPSVSVHHYELRLPATSLACVASTVTVAACQDAAVPCTNYATTIGGQTAILGTSGGPALGSTTVTFNAAGLATTTLSYLAAPNNTTATVSLSGESVSAQSARVCCSGSSCSVANSCSTLFNTAGFIVSSAANDTVATVPSQIAGVSSGNYYLRAVQSNTTTRACEAALTGTKSVEFAYECDGNPATCDGSNRMSVTGSSGAQTIARNNNDSVSSYQALNLTFDTNGNAPFSFTYGDVGQVVLWARKQAGSADAPTLLSTLLGSSNSFVVKPYDFGFTATEVKCGSSSGTVNPAATDAAGGKFCAAGSAFQTLVTARAAGGATTPSFGRCDSAGGSGCAAASETVTLSHTLVAPSAGVNGMLGGTLTANASAFVAGTGSYTFSNLNWSEVGIIDLKATNANYLSNNLAACSSSPSPGDVCRGTHGASGNVGRFYPHHFDVVLTPPTGCTGFIYGGHTESGPTVLLGQPFTVMVTARNGLTPASTTQNYRNSLGFAKNINLTLPAGGTVGKLYVDSTQGGNNAVPAARFTTAGVGTVNFNDSSGKISYVFNAAVPQIPTPVTVHADDVDSPPSVSTGDATIEARFGRLRLSNAFGSEKQNLAMPVRAEYWSSINWVSNTNDSCTTLSSGSFYKVSVSPTPASFAAQVSASNVALSSGSGVLTLGPPNIPGQLDIAANLGTSGNDLSCLGTHGGSPGGLTWFRSQYGNCASTYNRDPSARASFGVYSNSGRVVHVREFY